MKTFYTSVFLLLCATLVNAQVIHIPADLPTIQAGIDSAATSDTVLVAEGTYFENINFLGKAITVASQFILDGDTSHIRKTIIDGSQPSNPDTASVVIMWSGEDTTSVLMGFTVTGGTGTKFYSPERNRICSVGGGITVSNSGGKIIHNIIEKNYMIDWDGGGIRISYGGGLFIRVNSNHTAIIRKNVIRNNFLAAFADCRGAGAYLNGGRLLFEYNSVLNDTLIIISEDGSGAGVYWTNYAVEGTIEEAIIRNNIIKNNFATDPINAPAKGGGISLEGSFTQARVQVYNNIIEGNHADYGGGLFISDNRSAIFNNTIYNNTSEEEFYSNNIYFSVGNDIDANDIVMYNNIIWSEVDDDHQDIRIYDWGEREYTFSACNNILKKPFSEEDEVISNNNYYQEPVFKTDSTYELAENSPGIGWGADSLLVDGTWYYAPSFDFYGNPRPHPIDGRIDLGAVESPYEGFVYIPDTAFLHALIDEGVDANEDSLISYTEAGAMIEVNVSERGITDMTGIEAFVNLEILSCWGNQLAGLDISNNTNFKELNCRVNKLTNLVVSNNTYLLNLDCDSNQLTSLDISNNISLKELFCSSNQLTSLDVSNNDSLQKLHCGANYLSSLDVSKCKDLERLSVGNNRLHFQLRSGKSGDISAYDCYWKFLDELIPNPLTSLDLSNNLIILECGGLKLSTLDLRGQNRLEYLILNKMPELTQVCVDTVPMEYYWGGFKFPKIDTTGSPNVYFTECNTTGAEERSFGELLLYPNPTNNQLTIETITLGIHSLEIISLNGQLLYSAKMEGPVHHIDLSSFSKGVYFITIRSAERTITRKVIKL